MSHQLSAGALAKICQGEDITDPVLQVLGHQPIQGSGQERWGEKWNSNLSGIFSQARYPVNIFLFYFILFYSINGYNEIFKNKKKEY